MNNLKDSYDNFQSIFSGKEKCIPMPIIWTPESLLCHTPAIFLRFALDDRVFIDTIKIVH